MDMILSSQGFYGKAKDVIGEKVEELVSLKNGYIDNVVIITTAMKTYLFSERYIKYYAKNVAEVFNIHPYCIDIIDISKQFNPSKIVCADIVVVLGGNTYYLAKYMQQKSLYSILKNKKDGIYCGDSAGAIIAGVTIDTAPLTSHLGIADLNIYGVRDKVGMEIVPFSFWPDYNIDDTTKMENRLKNEDKFKNLFKIGVDEAYYFFGDNNLRFQKLGG